MEEPVAKEPDYWNDFTLWDTSTRYSRCGQKSYSIIFFSFQSVKSFQYKKFIQTAWLGINEYEGGRESPEEERELFSTIT